MAFCSNSGDSRIYSSALHNDTLYFVTGRGNDLYRATLGVPGSCKFVTLLPDEYNQTLYNSLTVDLYGRVFGISNGGLLFRYDQSSTNTVVLGLLPQGPSGDVLYYNGNMFYAAQSGDIYQINLDNPAASTSYMSVPQYDFFGLISFPYDCDKNKVYGIASSYPGSKLVGIDMENKTLTGEVCDFPFQIFDAGSVVEDGKTAGMMIDSVTVKGVCGAAQQGGTIKIHAFTATKGAIMYTLDGVTNNTGLFNNVSLGTHHITVTNTRNCTADTIIEVKPGLSKNYDVQTVLPTDCGQKNGQITITNAFTNYPPITYSFNGQPFALTNTFAQLEGGVYRIRIKDASDCEQDTTIILNYKNVPSFISGIVVKPTKCNKQSGSITIAVTGNASQYTTSLDNGTASQRLVYDHLDAKQYVITVYKGADCRFDTIVNLATINDNKPAIEMSTTQPTCGLANGQVQVNVTGQDQPYTLSINDVTHLGPEHNFTQLAAGSQKITITSVNGCSWDTAVNLDQYAGEAVNISIETINPTCKEDNSGSAKVYVNGSAPPYVIMHGDRKYNSGETIKGLGPGKYAWPVVNNIGCTRDTVHAALTLIEDPECDRFFMPNAFSPNGDGINDYAKPSHSAYLKNVRLNYYNRYGQLVFRYNGTGQGWDGRLNDQPQAGGGYTWQVTYKNYKGELVRKSGTIILIR